MVYSHLYIVAGFVLTKDQVIKSIREAGVELDPADEDTWSLELAELFNEHVIPLGDEWAPARGRTPIMFFSFPCCSNSLRKVFILGYLVHTYYRRNVQCKACEEYSVCNRCIGETNAGWYDVDKILNEPVKVPEEKVCYSCNSDQVGANGRCNLCFLEKKQETKRHSYEQTVRGFMEQVLVWGDVNIDDPLMGRYYMLDDCLSCT